MIDMHYDLLSILYYCYIRNDFTYVKSLQKNFNEQNVRGVIANLYFMSEEEMSKEMAGHKIDVCEMFRISTELFKEYFPNVSVVYSIEGSDYIKDATELQELYDLGLRSILLVWNNKNKYGSGPRSEMGLTTAGKEFLKQAVSLGIAIDLSHMNVNTFNDTVEFLHDLKEQGLNPKVIVSHSDVADLFDHPRNISKKAIASLKEFSPVMGLVSYSMFLSDKDEDILSLKDKYLKHIMEVVDILGIDNVGVSTDDMGYDEVLFANKLDKIVFPYENLKKELTDLLSKVYNEEEIKKILESNIENKLFREE